MIFVHAGSVFSGNASNVVMQSGQLLFGDGTGEQNFISVPGLGSILMPHGPTTGNLPVLNSANGAAVTLASNTILPGSRSPARPEPASSATASADVLIKNVTVNGSGSDGVQIVNATGPTWFNNVNRSRTPRATACSSTAAMQYLQFIGPISGSQGHDLLVENTGVGGVIDMTHALFPGSGSQGILLQNDSSQINFNNLLVGNTAGPGLAIENGSGNFQFGGTTIISGAGATSILVQGVVPTAPVQNGNGNVEQRPKYAGHLQQHLDRQPARRGPRHQRRERTGHGQRHNDRHQRGRHQPLGHQYRELGGQRHLQAERSTSPTRPSIPA